MGHGVMLALRHAGWFPVGQGVIFFCGHGATRFDVT